tara:strand:- start:608 stop:760 length:153 start_codon:yes stop_codon:yes gene_type:complete
MNTETIKLQAKINHLESMNKILQDTVDGWEQVAKTKNEIIEMYKEMLDEK